MDYLRRDDAQRRKAADESDMSPSPTEGGTPWLSTHRIMESEMFRGQRVGRKEEPPTVLASQGPLLKCPEGDLLTRDTPVFTSG